jgi:hypothetical protein
MDPIPDAYIIGTLGRLGVAVFAVYLASMIFDSRRGSKVDVALAAVLLTWGVVEAIDAYRYSQQLIFLPFYLSRGLWVLTLVVEIVAVFYIRQERRQFRAKEEVLVSRQEQAVKRQEDVTDRQEVLINEAERKLTP